MRASGLDRIVVLAWVLASQGCSLVVYNDATTPAACDDDADCAAGEGCIDDTCDVIDPGSVPDVGTSVGVGGGTVAGPDGVVLDVPPGALPGNFTITIERTTSTLPRDNIGDGVFYAIRPALNFAIMATITLPLDDNNVDNDVDSAWVSPLQGVSWEALAAADGARFVLPRTGVVVRAAETP
jgi:hypothetical protein